MAFLKSFLVERFLSVWWLAVVLLLALPFGVWLVNAVAAPSSLNACRSFNGHQVCVDSIRRSAKHPWEYRTVVSLDGIRQPLEFYNCRDRTRTLPSDGSRIPFLTGQTGDWICTLTKPARAPRLRERVDITLR